MSRLTLLVLLLAPSGAQPLDSARAQQDDDTQKNTALLKIYPRLEDLTIRAEQLARDGKYTAALEIYGDAWENYPNHVVPADGQRALGVWEYAMEKVAKWPEAGREAYRRVYDPRAMDVFERAKRNQDLEALEEIAQRYPLTSVIDDALMLLANLALEAADPDRAVRALERVLVMESDVPRPLLFARLGQAYAQAHEKDRLQTLYKRAEKELKDAKIRVRGGEELLVDYLYALTKTTTARERETRVLDLPSWPMIGGAADGSHLAESGVTLGPAAWNAAIPLPGFETEDDFSPRRYPRAGPGDAYRPLFPAVADGIVYVHNEYSVLAYNLFAGHADLLWSFRLQPPPGVLMFEDRLVHTTTVHNGRVYANLITALGNAEDQLGYVRVKFPFPRRALFAFDAYSGKLLWKAGGVLQTDALEENASFSTAPTPDGDRLYVGVVKQKYSTDPFEHYVACLDAATGKFLWSTFVGSGLTEINLFGNSTRESLGTPVSIGGETLYYGTNHGVVAAVDKKTGHFKWAYRYTQLPVNPTRSIYVQRNRLEWVNGPPVVARGQAIFAPTDSRYLYALDAASGERLWRIPRSDEVRHVYGVSDNVLVLGGEELHLYNLSSGGKFMGSFRPRSPGCGRGVVASDRAYIPTTNGLQTVSLAGPREIEYRPWPATRGGGNVIVVDGMILLTGQDTIEVFADKRPFEKAVQDELERDPENPVVLYRAALRYLQAGQPDESARLFEKVIMRLTGSTRPDEDRICRSARKRLYAVAMASGRDALDAGQLDKAAERYARAREIAPDGPSEVSAGLRLADVHLARKQVVRAIEVLQAILEEAPEAFAEIREKIGLILAHHGRDGYASFEKKAGEMLARARRVGSPDEMLDVFRLYPNSLAAERALLEAADVYARAGRPDDQMAVLRQFVRDFPDSPRLDEATATLVRALESKGAYSSAASLLRAMLRRRPDGEVTDGERKVPIREFVQKRLESEPYLKAAASRGTAALKAPLKVVLSHVEKNFPEGAPLLVQGPAPKSAESRAFMNYGGAVKAFDLDRGGEAWTLRLEGAARFACWHEDALIVATDAAIARVDPVSGKVEWTHASRGTMRGFALVGNQVCFLSTESGRAGIAAVDALRGTPSWRQPFEGQAASRVWAAGETAVFITVSPNRIYAFDAETGKKTLAAAQFSGGITTQVLHATDSLLLLWSNNGFVEAYEIPAGTLKWRVSLKNFSAKILEVNSTSLFIVGGKPAKSSFDEETFAATIDLKTGKYTKLAENVDLGDPRYALLDEERAYVVSRDGGSRAVTIREITLSDMKVGWKETAGAGMVTLYPPSLTRDHAVVFTFERSDAGKFNFSLTLLDKKGRKVQNIKSEFQYERPPNYLVANDALMISVDAKVEVLK